MSPTRDAGYRLRSHPIGLTRRLRDDEEARILLPTIEDLMRRLRNHRAPGARRQIVENSRELKGKLASEHIEELGGLPVQMAPFCSAGRHALLYDTEAGGAVQVPAIAMLRTNGA